ncbi:MAG: CpaF family protein [Candidatus Hydrothermarchaeota archaeon]
MSEKEERIKKLTGLRSQDSKKFLDEILSKGEQTKTNPVSEAESKPEIKSFERVLTEDAITEREYRDADVIDSYGRVEILQVGRESIPIYKVNIPKFTEEKELIKKIRELAISEIKIDPDSIPDPVMRRQIFMNEIEELIKKTDPSISPGKRKLLAEYITSNMIGYGLLDYLIEDDNLEEVMVIATGKPVYVAHRKYDMCKTNLVFESDEDIKLIIERIARPIGRRIDHQSPLLDARLPDGSRVNATIPPVSLDGPTLTIRKFREDPLTIVDIMNFRTLSPDVAAFLWLCVEGLGTKPANILVSGGTGSGKTTTANSLATFIPDTDRVVTIEDTAELKLPIKHWVRLETRPANIEGRGEISMNDLVKNTLRMRPDRIIVGEVRGPEAKTLFTAMNTGHDGCMGTIHSNSAQETITRLTSAPMNVPEIMIPSLDLIIMQNRYHHREKGSIRRVTEIAEVAGMERGKIQLNRIYEWDPKTDTIRPTGVPSRLKQEIGEYAGMVGDELNTEIKKREEILRWMIEKGIRSVEEVGQIVQLYYQEPDTLLDIAMASRGVT